MRKPITDFKMMTYMSNYCFLFLNIYIWLLTQQQFNIDTSTHQSCNVSTILFTLTRPLHFIYHHTLATNVPPSPQLILSYNTSSKIYVYYLPIAPIITIVSTRPTLKSSYIYGLCRGNMYWTCRGNMYSSSI